MQTESLSVEINGQIRYPSFFQICDDFFIVSYSKQHIFNPEILRVYDLTTKTNFDLVDVIEPGYFEHFDYQNNYLHLIDSTNLTIYSYKPQNSTLISQTAHNLSAPIYNFHVTNNYTFVSTEFDTHVFNITNPITPIEIFRFTGITPYTQYGFSDVVISDDIIYALDRGNCLYFINFEDRTSPYLEGIFSCDELLTSFDVSENKVYLSAIEVNLEIVQLDRFIKPRLIIIIASIVSVVVISGIAVMVLVLRRRKIKKQAIQN